MSARALIICLEGPSAVGKSTVARHLADNHGFLIVPEVNELFRNERRDGDDWYLQRQVDRYALSITAAASGQVVVLDGDPFQPLWYNWVYPEHEPFGHVAAFYREAIKAGVLAFPDIYAVLQVPIEGLAARKTGDGTRRRRNFERHLQMITPQRRYFEQLGAHGLTKVELMANINVEDTALKITQMVKGTPAMSESARLLSIAADWLARNRPADAID